jgi:branched-chain amino acid transport system permease protein
MVDLNFILQALIAGCLVGMSYALMAIGFTFIFGVLRIVNFAHGHLVVAAGFLTFALLTYLHIHPYLSFIFIIPIFFLLGIAIYKGLLRHILKAPTQSQFALTIGLMIFIEHILLLCFGGKMRSTPIRYTYKSIMFGPISIGGSRLVAFLIALASVFILYLLLRKTFWGKAVRAVADDRDSSQLVGVNLEKIFISAVGLSVVYAAIGGIAVMPYTVIQPSSGIDFMIRSFMVVVLGGIGSIGGAIVGGLIVGIIETVAVMYFVETPSLAYVVSLFVLITMIFIKPSGLLGGKLYL